MLPRTGERAQAQVFQHTQIGEHFAPFGYLDEPALHDAAVVRMADVLPVKCHAARPHRHDATHRVVERGFARAVAAQQGHDLALHHRQTHTAQHFHAAVTSAQILDLQQRRHGARDTGDWPCKAAAAPLPK